MNLRASSLLTLPVLALLAAGCATSNPNAARSTEVDDVYFSSSDRIAPRYSAPTTAAYDPTAPPAPDGSVANPDYTGQQNAGQQDYYGGAYAATPRVTSPYYGSFNQYNSGYAYDPFWSGSSLAIGCGPGYAWGPSPFVYAPIYVGPRVRFGVSFGYGWGGYSSWAAPMYGWAGPTFYDPFYSPFWGPAYGYDYFGGGYGYCGGGYGYYGGGWRNGYNQGFYDGAYSGGGGIRNGRRVTYGPRLDRSGDRTSTTAYSGSGRATRRGDERTVAPGAGGSGYQPASYSGYGGGASRAAASGRGAAGSAMGAPAFSGSGGATRATRAPAVVNPAQPQQPTYQSQLAQPREGNQPATRYQTQPQVAPQVLPQGAPQPEQRQGNIFQRAARNMSSNESPTRAEAPNRTYSAPASAPRPSGGNFGGGGGVRSSSGGNNGSGTRRSR